MARQPGGATPVNEYGYRGVGSKHTHVRPKTRVLVRLFDGDAFVDRFLRTEGGFHYFANHPRVKSRLVYQLTILTKSKQAARGIVVGGTDQTPGTRDHTVGGEDRAVGPSKRQEAETQPAVPFGLFAQEFATWTPWPAFGRPRDTLLRPVRRYQDAYAAALSAVLRGVSSARLKRRYAGAGEDLTDYAGSGLADTHIRAVEAAGEGLPDRYVAVREFAWIHLMLTALPFWQRILEGRDLSPQQITGLQFWRAMEAMMMMQARENNPKMYAGPYAATEHAKGFRRFQGESLAEYDLMILLLELAKTRPWLDILPAPAHFTRGPNGSAVVLLDRERREVVAVRVRADDGQVDFDSPARPGPAGSDTGMAVVVDSALDLGNIVRLRLPGDGATVGARAWPGVVAAQRLAEHRKYGDDLRHVPNPPQLLHFVKTARRLTEERAGTIDLALETLRTSILGRFARERETSEPSLDGAAPPRARTSST